MALIQTLAEMPQPVDTSGAESRKSMRRLAELMAKQGVDASPVQHWTQGLSRVTNAMMGGYLDNLADKQAKAEETKTVETLRKALGLSPETEAPAQTVAPSTQPPPDFAPPAFPQGTRPPASVNDDAVTTAATPQAYINRAFGATPQDREIATRTVLGEAANQGQQGMNAVADVIRNRATAGGYGGDTIGQVSQARNQFEPWNTPQGRARMAGYSPDSPQYAAAQGAVDSAGIGTRPDVSGGAHYFFAPKAQAQLAPIDGRPVVPSFAAGRTPTAVVGAHNFYGPTTRTVQAGGAASQAGPGGAPPQGQPQAPQGGRPPLDPRVRATVEALISNPQTRAAGLQIWAQHMKPADKPTHGVIGEDQYGNKQYGWINPQTQTTTPSQPQGAGASQEASTIPPPPPGVDPKAWRTEMTKRVAGETLPGESAARIGLARTFMNDVPKLKESIRSGNVTGLIDWSAARIGYGQQGETYRKIQSGVDALRRSLTGAGMGVSEASEYAGRYLPMPQDKAEVVESKIDQLSKELQSIEGAFMEGRTLPGAQTRAAPQGSPAAQPAPQPAPQPQAQRSIGGKNYVKINGQWFEQ